jgi:hypothetical protein
MDRNILNAVNKCTFAGAAVSFKFAPMLAAVGGAIAIRLAVSRRSSQCVPDDIV